MSDTICRGTLHLGSACRRCSKCTDQIVGLILAETRESIETLISRCHVRWTPVDETRRLFVDRVDADAVNHLFSITLLQMEMDGMIESEDIEVDDGWVSVYRL